MNFRSILLTLIVGGIALALACSVVFVDETETVLITQFGRPIRTLDTAGLYFKAPYQSTLRVDRRLQMYDPPPSEFLAAEKKNVDLDVFVCWRVGDATLFLKTVNGFLGAESRIHDIIFSELRAEVGRNSLETLVSVDGSPFKVDQFVSALTAVVGGRVQDIAVGQLAAETGQNLLRSFGSSETENHRLNRLMAGVTARSNGRVRAAYGIEIVDVRLKRISLPDQVRDSVFQRMRSERTRIAERYRAEGEEEAMKIRGAAKKLETVTLAKAKAEAKTIRGRAEAEATRTYADAHQQDPAFYELTRKLEAYEKFLGEKTTIILSTDSDLLKYLTQEPHAVAEPHREQQ